jgi:acetyl esterase/lipase
MENASNPQLETTRLKAVNSYLRALADKVAEVVPDLGKIRALIDEYAAVDASTSVLSATSRKVNAGHVPGEWLTTDSSAPADRLLYVHGGSWMSGSLEGYRAHVGRLAAETDCAVLNIEYRLAPEHPFPAGLEDCDRAFDWMLENGPDGPGRARSTFVAGDSAGGNLVLALLLKRRDQNKALPKAAVALSPATDLTWSSPSIRQRAAVDPILRAERIGTVVHAYLQNAAAVDDPYVSPLYGELSGLPPLMLQAGGAEILYDDSRRFAEKAEAAGIDVYFDAWPDLPHVFQMFAPYLPQASRALRRIGAFVHRGRDERGA